MSKKMDIAIRGREELFFEGQADYVSSVNDSGPFDILPGHANFITLIKGEVKVTNKGEVAKKFTFDDALMRVEGDKIKIYLGIR